MKDINILQNVMLDRRKIAALVKEAEMDDIQRLLGVKKSQAYYVRRGQRPPTVDGLLRLMLVYGVRPEDIVTTKAG